MNGCDILKISEAELEVMHVLWKHGPSMTAADIQKHLIEKGWKPTTLLTFLSRLKDKGMITARKIGKANLYSVICTEEDYQSGQTKYLLEEMFGGSVKNMIATLYDNHSISSSELEELEQWLKER